jgi:hypothetical protein
MAKTNFTKVEEALDEGLRKITINRLLQLADVAAGIGQTKPQTKERDEETHAHIIASIQRDLKFIVKKDPSVFSKIGFKKKDVKDFIDRAHALTPEEWEALKKIQEKVESYKKELVKSLPKTSNEDLIEGERVKHINKRFNVNEKWLPLK